MTRVVALYRIHTGARIALARSFGTYSVVYMVWREDLPVCVDQQRTDECLQTVFYRHRILVYSQRNSASLMGAGRGNVCEWDGTLPLAETFAKLLR